MRPASFSGFSLSNKVMSSSGSSEARISGQWVFDAGKKFDMRAVGLACAVANPQHMGGCVVIFAAGAVEARQCLLKAQQQSFVAGVEIHHAHLRRGQAGNAAGRHEIHRFINLVCRGFIAGPLWAFGDKALVPTMYFRQIGIATLGKCAQKIQRRGRLPIGRDLAFGVGHARGGVKFNAIDDITAIAGQFNAVDCFGIGRARFGKLSGHAADFDDRQLGTIGQYNCHLQQDAECVADIVGVVFHKARRSRRPEAGKRGLRILRQGELSGFVLRQQKQAAKSGKAFFHRLQGFRIFICRHLLDRKIRQLFKVHFSFIVTIRFIFSLIYWVYLEI